MTDEMKAKLGSMLGAIDKDKIKKFMENGGAEKLSKMLSEEDKKRMSDELLKMDEEEIRKKLRGVDLKNIDIESVLRKMKQ